MFYRILVISCNVLCNFLTANSFICNVHCMQDELLVSDQPKNQEHMGSVRPVYRNPLDARCHDGFVEDLKSESTRVHLKKTYEPVKRTRRTQELEVDLRETYKDALDGMSNDFYKMSRIFDQSNSDRLMSELIATEAKLATYDRDENLEYTGEAKVLFDTCEKLNKNHHDEKEKERLKVEKEIKTDEKRSPSKTVIS